MVADMVGADLATWVDDGFPRIMVTEDQGLLARQLGAHRVDWLEPKYQYAAMTGDLEGIATVEAYRRAWTHPRR
jgi:hypothetical protein